MQKVREYKRRAREARAEAKKCDDLNMHQALVNLAESWELLAREREQLIKQKLIASERPVRQKKKAPRKLN